MVVGERIPRPIDLQWSGGVAAVGVAEIGSDAAVLSLELLDRVERIAAMQAGDRRIQPSAGDEQQGDAGPGLLIMDPNRPSFVEGHGSASLFGLLGKPALLGGHRRFG